MAFSIAGHLGGGSPVVIPKMQVGANVYQGQILIADYTVSGEVIPSAVAVAGPDVTQKVIGICTGVVTDPAYDSTYKGDMCTYDVTQATLTANDPVGPACVEVTRILPNTLIKAPLVKDTIGTAPESKACTTGSADGLTFVIAAIDSTTSLFSTAYCRKGANRGEYRVITTGATETQTMVIPFQNDIAIGDEFTVVNVRRGFAHIDWDSQFQGVDTSTALSYHFKAFVHEINLEEAGKEYIVFTLDPSHLL